jgi:hypothetical protein
MRDEVQEHNALLREMDRRSSEAQGGLDGTLRQLGDLLAAGGGATNVFAVVGLAVVAFLVLYFLVLR